MEVVQVRKREREAEVINIPKVYPAAHQSCHGQIWVARAAADCECIGEFKSNLGPKRWKTSS